MKHDFTASAFGFRLRPVEIEDAAFIILLRANPEHARFLNPTSADLGEQIAYLRALFVRPGDYSFVFERVSDGHPEGLVAICDVDESTRTAEWGRWILRPGSLAAPICAWLTYQIGFEQMGLNSLYCRTVMANAPVLGFHDSFGATRGRVLPKYFRREGKDFDSIEHVVLAADWPSLRLRHEPLLRRLGPRLQAAI